jgi:hypothetical protein
LRTVNGRLCATFKEACFARGLLEDDREWNECLEQASLWATGVKLRSLFVTILRDCQPIFPVVLWEKFKDHLCDDLERALQRRNIPHPSADQILDYGLFFIDCLMQESGQRLSNIHGMPLSVMDWGSADENRLIAEQLQWDPVEQTMLAVEAFENMNAEQQAARNAILQAVEEKTGKVFFLHGPAGTGKTFTYRALCHVLRGQSKVVLCVASSGIAALLLPGGRTSHSRFKIPIELFEESVCSISKQGELADLLRKTELIIWDKLPMQHRHAPEAVSQTLCDVRNDNRPFGGIVVVFGGDFQQILPVVPKGSRPQIVGACYQSSPLWLQTTHLYLTQNMRLGQTAEDRHYAKWLQEMGHGQHTEQNGNIQLPAHVAVPENKVESLIDKIYPGFAENGALTPEYLSEHTILSARNDDVDDVNSIMLACIPGEEIVYQSADSALDMGNTEDALISYTTEYLNSITVSGLPLSKLTLKVGCPLMVIRNLDASNGVCNGTRAILRRVASRVLEVEIVGGEQHGERALIPRIDHTAGDTLPFQLKRRQFPVQLAFAMTINESRASQSSMLGLTSDLLFSRMGNCMLQCRVSHPLRAHMFCSQKVQPVP